MTGVLIKSPYKEGGRESEEGNVMIEAEMRVIQFEDGGRGHKPRNTGSH